MNQLVPFDASVWKRCSACKKPIAFSQPHFVCSVSTCNGQRTGYVFCSVSCWETHLPGARHRDAAAVEAMSPRRGAIAESVARAPQRVIAASPSSVGSARVANAPHEVLIIASRLKEFVDSRSGGYNTSQSVIDVLSDHVRAVCERAIDNARADGRKTVMDRDFEFLKHK